MQMLMRGCKAAQRLYSGIVTAMSIHELFYFTFSLCGKTLNCTQELLHFGFTAPEVYGQDFKLHPAPLFRFTLPPPVSGQDFKLHPGRQQLENHPERLAISRRTWPLLGCRTNRGGFDRGNCIDTVRQRSC